MLELNLLLFPRFLSSYERRMAVSFPETHSAIEAFSEEISSVIIFDERQDGWSNTLLAPLHIAVDRRMLGLPAGIGISGFTSINEISQIKSRYLLLDEGSYEILKDRVPLELMLTTAIGDLYVNQTVELRR